MKSLHSFLHPKRKENLQFILSDAFIDEKGNPITWEMRQLSAEEGIELQRQISSKDYMEVMTAYVAESLVYPDLKNDELLKGLSEREGHRILTPVDAIKVLVTDSELARMITLYNDFNELGQGLSKDINDAKN